MQEKARIYQYQGHKLLTAFLGPLLMALLLGLLLFELPSKTGREIPLSIKVFFATILASMYVLPVVYLIYRHWKYGRHVIFSIEGTQFVIKMGDNALKFDKASVNAITCFTTRSHTPWGWGCWWELVIDEKVHYLSCLVVPQVVMERHFYKKIVEKQVLWPDIRMDKLLDSIANRSVKG